MKRLIPLVLVGFGVALAIVIGQRMSTDAMAVVIGVAVGIAASVPTSLLLVALLRRERQAFRHEQPEQPYYPPGYLPNAQQPPNLIVIDPAQFGQYAQRNVPLPPPNPAPDAGVRRLRVVGDDADWN